MTDPKREKVELEEKALLDSSPNLICIKSPQKVEKLYSSDNPLTLDFSISSNNRVIEILSMKDLDSSIQQRGEKWN